MTVKNLHKSTAEVLRRVFIGNDFLWPVGNPMSAEIFFKNILSQGMAPVLYCRIGGQKGCASWPLSVQSGLRDAALWESAADLLLQKELTGTLNVFAETGLKPILLKGTPLSYTVYPAPGLRPKCDTDMLIPESARGKAADIMGRLGYEGLHEADVDFINTQMSYSKKGNLTFRNSYDIHWQTSNSNREFSREFNYDRLAAGSVNIPALGENSWTLNNVDALVLACFHRAGHFSHSGDRLIWLYDVHLLVEALTEEESAAFAEISKELRVTRLCADAIVTAQSWFGTRLSSALESLLRVEPKKESSSVYLQPGRLRGIKNRAVLDLKSLDTRRERLRYLVQNAFPPAEYMLWRYNKKQKVVLPWLYLKRFAQGAYIFLRR